MDTVFSPHLWHPAVQLLAAILAIIIVGGGILWFFSRVAWESSVSKERSNEIAKARILLLSSVTMFIGAFSREHQPTELMDGLISPCMTLGGCICAILSQSKISFYEILGIGPPREK